MAVYYKFKSAKDFDTLPMDGPSILVGLLKERIFELKQLGRGKDFDLMVTNAQTKEDYNDTDLIPKHTSVLIRRVPGRPCMPIVREQMAKVVNKVEESRPEKSSLLGVASLAMKNPDDSEWDEFGSDLYSTPEVLPVQFNKPITEASLSAKAEEDSKIRALIDTPALDWRQGDGYGPGRGFGRGRGGRMMGGRGFGLGLDWKTPLPGYVCFRCNIPGHFIQHCPTNGDSNFDIKRVRPPTGIPKSMLRATPDGSYVLPSGAAAVLKPNEAAFEKEIEGLPSTRSVGDLPPELHCPLCKNVMKDGVLTSKCCFNSFCDKCIRDYIISKSVCVCGATNVLADDLLPNKTLRETINRMLESGSCIENASSTYQVQVLDRESNIPQPKVPSPTAYAASKGEPKLLPHNEVMHSPIGKESVNEEKAVTGLQQTLSEKANANDTQQLSEKANANDTQQLSEKANANDTQQLSEKANATDTQMHSEDANGMARNQTPGNVSGRRVSDASEGTNESMTVKEPASQGGAQVVKEEVQPKVAFGEADLQGKNPQDLSQNYMMPMGPTSFNPYWGGMQPVMEGFGGPFAGAMPYMGYGLGPFEMRFGGMMPQDPYAHPGYMMLPVPHQRDLAELGMGMNGLPPAMSKEEFEAWKKDANRRRGGTERQGQREPPRDREFDRGFSSGPDVLSMKSNSRPVTQTTAADHHSRHRHRSERFSPDQSTRDHDAPPRPPKRTFEHNHHRDNDQDRDRERASIRERDHKRHHHQGQRNHRLESSSRRSSEPVAKPTTAADKKKSSVFSRISFPEEGPSLKRRKVSSSNEAHRVSSSVRHKSTSNGYNDDYKSSLLVKAEAVASGGGRKSSTAVDYESSDDDRHLKRKRSRYERSPPPQAEREENGRHARGPRDKDRKHR